MQSSNCSASAKCRVFASSINFSRPIQPTKPISIVRHCAQAFMTMQFLFTITPFFNNQAIFILLGIKEHNISLARPNVCLSLLNVQFLATLYFANFITYKSYSSSYFWSSVFFSTIFCLLSLAPKCGNTIQFFQI